MNKIILLLCVVLLSMTSVRAQTSPEKKEVYEQLSDWAVVKLTIAYMEDLYLFKSEEKGETGSNKEYLTYKILYDKYSSFIEDINLDTISEILINGDWIGTEGKQFSNYKKQLDNSNDYTNFEKEKFSFPFSENSAPTTNISRLKAWKDIVEKSNELINKNSPEDDSEIVSPLSPANKKINKDERIKISWLAFLSYGLLIITLIIIIILLFLKKEKLNKELKKSKDNYDYSLKEWQIKIKELERKEIELKKDNDDLNNELKEKAINQDENLPKPIHDEPSKIIELDVREHKKTSLIYLSSPFEDLKFAKEVSSEDKKSNSLYIAELNGQTQTGELSVIVDADLSRALNSQDSYLKTACSYDNEYFNNAKGIQVTGKGEIKLDGQDWIVTKKVSIKFI